MSSSHKKIEKVQNIPIYKNKLILKSDFGVMSLTLVLSISTIELQRRTIW